MLEALREAGMYVDTTFFLSYDPGDFTGDYGLVEKTQNVFEDCLSRVPFVIKPHAWAQVDPRVSDAMVELIDSPATVESLAGLEPAHTHSGHSLTPVLAGETETHRDAVFCEGGHLHGERHCTELESDTSQVPTGIYWPRVSLQTGEGPERKGRDVPHPRVQGREAAVRAGRAL